MLDEYTILALALWPCYTPRGHEAKRKEMGASTRRGAPKLCQLSSSSAVNGEMKARGAS